MAARRPPLARIASLAASAALLLASGPARADLDHTLDLSLHASRSQADWNTVGSPAPFEARGVGGRLGVSRGELRFGGGLAVDLPEQLRTPLPALVGRRAWVGSAEAFVGWAPGGYWRVRPTIELRAHVDRLFLGGGGGALSLGLGPRIGVLVPLSEYFFLDVGVGRDLVGPEQLRATLAIGLPIPLSHL